MSDELEVCVAKALFRFEQCDREQAKDIDGGWIGRLDNQDRAEYLGMAREAIHEVHADTAQADERERDFVKWLVETLHFPFDVSFDTPPPVNPAHIAAYWSKWENWGISSEEALQMIREEGRWDR